MTLKLNETIYNKLLAQAEEAKEQGMTKLAESILEAIGSFPADEVQEYSYTQLNDDIHRDMWKIASRLMVYYDVTSADAEKVDQAIVSWASKVVTDLEVALSVDSVVKGPLEPPVPGEDK
jgi:hypothetical protein